MKNLIKFLFFVLLVSAGISALYDYRLKTGGLDFLASTAEKYSLATAPSVDPKDVAGLENLNRERRALVSSVIPSVVSIKTSKKVPVRRQYQLDPSEFFNRNPRQFRNPNDEALVQNSLGSGVVVTSEGHIITNNHVVDQVDEIEVQLSDGRSKKAKLIGADAVVDLAVLKIDEPGLKPLKLGDSDAVQAGDFVVAIGNPFGFEETVTDGIISSKGRPNRADGFGDYLQTNAAINPGNSGGPLVNLRGEIIGINTAIISRVADNDGGIIDDVIPNSPAADANLKRDDVIKKFNGHTVRNLTELRSLVSQVELNKKVDIELVRNGSTMTLSTELKEQPADYLTSRNNRQPQTPQQPDDQQQDQPDEANALSSVEVADVTADVVKRLDLPNRIRGVLVTKVDGEVGELRAGDVIEEVNQQPVTSVSEYKRIVGSLDPNGTQVLSVCRHRTRSFVVLRAR